jgi:hypothetical protein
MFSRLETGVHACFERIDARSKLMQLWRQKILEQFAGIFDDAYKPLGIKIVPRIPL